MIIVRSVKEVGSTNADYVFLITRDITGRIVKQTNLTKATKEERIKLLAEAGIPLK